MKLAQLWHDHVADGNGYGVARYVSIEQRIYESKNSYHASLCESQRNWHEIAKAVTEVRAVLKLTVVNRETGRAAGSETIELPIRVLGVRAPLKHRGALRGPC